MKRLSLSLVLLFIAPASVAAQDDHPRVELFGGYSYLNTDFADREGMHGWSASLAGNFSKNFGLVVEATGQYGTVTELALRIGGIEIPPFDVPTRVHTLTAGPRISAREKA